MASEQFVDVSYRGLEVGRRLKLREFGPRTAYLELGVPMPVGTVIEIATDEGVRVAARVLRVHEQVAGKDLPPGMRIGADALEGDAATWWQSLVDAADPDIPAPPRRPAQPEPQGAAAAEAEQTPPAEAEPAPPAEAEAAGDGTVAEPADSARATTVMSTADIEALVDDGDGVPRASDGNGNSAARTKVMAAVDIEALTEKSRSEDGGSNGSEPAPKGKRKRRRRRKTRG